MVDTQTLPEFQALGKRVSDITRKLETFPAPEHVQHVTYTSDEVTALCPVTGQPDWYIVEIEIEPNKLCIESKSLKLFLQSFRNEGHFCEQFAEIIADEIAKQVRPHYVNVAVKQKPRGGISIEANAEREVLA